ncbi:MAG: hypothetical protein LBE91_08155 [Tannerella sp.]|jgi:hypothetical protein|nr:hypothetical protein [Tannerella sp.]
MTFLTISICLSDLPKEKIKEFGSDRKKWIDLTCVKRRQVGKDGDTHFICVKQTKEEREAKAPVIYVGRAKEYEPSTAPEKSVQNTLVEQQNDGLPF